MQLAPAFSALLISFSLRTLSNSFPLWKEPELTGLFYHIQAPFSTAKYENQTENAVSRCRSKARRFISRLEPIHKTYGQLSLLVKSRSLLMPMPKWAAASSNQAIFVFTAILPWQANRIWNIWKLLCISEFFLRPVVGAWSSIRLFYRRQARFSIKNVIEAPISSGLADRDEPGC